MNEKVFPDVGRGIGSQGLEVFNLKELEQHLDRVGLEPLIQH